MHKKSDHYWISMSDIMTGLMVIFMFISVAYILQLKQQQKERNQILEEYKNVKMALFNELQKEFENDFKKERWDAIIGEDLTIRFKNEKVLFDYNKSDLRPQFKNILDNFFTRYFTILLKAPYKKHIAEVRIKDILTHGVIIYITLDLVMSEHKAYCNTFLKALHLPIIP